MIRRLKQRDPAAAGVVGLVLITVVSLLAFYFEDLPVVGGTTYRAQFTEAAGLKPDDEVRIAGVKAGTVTSMSLRGKHVEVAFRVDDAWVGDRTTASIEIKTLLGQKFLSLDPRGEREQDPSEPITAERTRSPYDVTEAFQDLGRTSGEVDTAALAQSFQTMADTFRGTPAHVGEALRGLTAFSQVISRRDEQLDQLLSGTRQVSQVLADRDQVFAKLIADGNLLMEEIRFRRDAIATLLRSTRELSEQLRGLVADNRAQLQPALATLQRVTEVLHRNQDNLNRGLQNLAPFARYFSNTVANGRWFDSYVCGQVPPVLQLGPVTANEQGCAPPIEGGSGRGGPR
ncbi:MCE family protein [Saccharopolyspora rhizosphaerae]|uniref:MCE family protein n=1 Tax=Saccharopolyspora rhizosphaerae TaxID=2492662 RepID=A0A426JLS2_9PSEU|nr:MCE family protein [Saccharopolyspora rhizosphaerae]RRO14173.1 MCE family protein [Saccharopolyspora rhizosphaerae]